MCVLQELQSTLPAKGATSEKEMVVNVDLTSIHAPSEGSDYISLATCKDLPTSIHAPSEGSDRGLKKAVRIKEDFNPRSQRRERHGRSPGSAGHEQTSIHAPSEGSDKKW